MCVSSLGDSLFCGSGNRDEQPEDQGQDGALTAENTDSHWPPHRAEVWFGLRQGLTV